MKTEFKIGDRVIINDPAIKITYGRTGVINYVPRGDVEEWASVCKVGVDFDNVWCGYYYIDQLALIPED